jgi:hypothetical protein
LDIISAKDTLLLFNENADELEKSSFIRDYEKTAIVHLYNRQPFIYQSTRFKGPTNESIKAFVLTLRLFLQNNESISLDNITKLYAKLSVDDELANGINELNSKINIFLDAISNFYIFHTNTASSNLTTYKCVYTYRNLLNIFLYGKLAHTNNKKMRIMYDDLKNRPYFTKAEVEFIYALKTYLDTIFLIRDINNKALNKLINSS